MTLHADMKWEILAPRRFELGESPFWHPLEHALYWLDIAGRKLLRWRAGAVDEWNMPQEPGCMAPVRNGGLVIALRDGVYRASRWGAPLVRLAAACHDPRTTRFNDGKCDPLGRFWAGTIYEPRDVPGAELFCLDCRDGRHARLERMADGVTVANGLAWSPDATRMYWTDTTTATVRTWPWQAAANHLGEPKVLHRFAVKPAGWQSGEPGYGGRPDGAAVDVHGHYWVAMYEGARLLKLDTTGAVLAEFPLPVQCPTMVCFGGDDLKTLFVTSASHGRAPAELQRLPWSGCVLTAPVDVAGLPVNFFSDGR